MNDGKRANRASLTNLFSLRWCSLFFYNLFLKRNVVLYMFDQM